MRQVVLVSATERTYIRLAGQPARVCALQKLIRVVLTRFGYLCMVRMHAWYSVTPNYSEISIFHSSWQCATVVGQGSCS